ncbi:Ribosomal protein S18 acetylase RimI [Blastococcus sp. DSM 46786]|uniref:GNAT family N-acetyltransferase n=1 Tax=Blastococcus sp. DSM 46786 TaxID=1798227 RepID=UPI0008CDA4AF|nr:GNAT family N-acetyltransferase [Blastococcus sp. DSM 46786]SEK97321.1 Ribosomal protein S18 acetylase RimI [Blastococcus sp. DSM 46786]
MTSNPFPRLTGSADVSVRPAQAGDAAAIARVQGVTWRTAYRTLLPAAVLDEWDEAAVADSWLAAVTAPPSAGHRVLVAVERDAVVGFAAVATGPEAAEISTLLVEPRWGRRGHGSRLLAAVTDLASADGTTRLEVWLAESDQASADFYESAGWAPDGWARTLDTGAAPLRELRWHVELGEEDADR